MIHIIRENEKRVLFLSNRLEFYKINEHTENLINALQQEVNISDIKKRFGVELNEIQKVRNILKRDEKFALLAKDYPYLRKLVLNISNSCNLNCRYCYANGGSYNSREMLMRTEIARKAIDRFLYIFGEIECIQFFGGEPLLNYRVVEFVCEYISELYRKEEIQVMPRFGIVTNGTIMNDEILEILEKYHIDVTISCDGPEEVNDKLRVSKNKEGTYQKVAKNIELLREKIRIVPNIEVTYTEYHHKNGITIPDLLNFFNESFGIKNVHIAPVSLEKTNELALHNFEDFLNTISEDTIKQNQVIFKVKNLIYNLQHKCGDCKICGAGTDTFSVSVNGQVYPCFMMTDIQRCVLASVNQEKEIFRKEIKNARERYYFNMIEQFPCKQCFNNLLCNGCMGSNIFETGDPLQPSGEQCGFLKDLTEKVILELANLK